MLQLDDSNLSELFLKSAGLRIVEPHIYSVLPGNEVGNSYDEKFGNFYDWVACNPIYNRLIWGYSTARFASLTRAALNSSTTGYVLDIGCGSLAFTAETYVQYSQRPVVLMDQSLKLLRIAKSRLIKLNGKIPGNMVFLHGDALQMPFAPQTFRTIICLNLLHVLADVDTVLAGLKNVLAEEGTILFTTLVRGNRLADKYLKVWEDAGEVVSRDSDQLKIIFHRAGMPFSCELNGNMAFVQS